MNDELPSLPTLMEVVPNIDCLDEFRRLKLDTEAKLKIGGTHISKDLLRMLGVPIYFKKKNMIGDWVSNQDVFKSDRLLSFNDFVAAAKQNFVYLNSPEDTYDYSKPIDNQKRVVVGRAHPISTAVAKLLKMKGTHQE